MKKRLSVVAALLRDGDRILLGKRPEGNARAGLWELIGGKVENGETEEKALVREIFEETGAEISVLRKVGETDYDGPDISIRLSLYESVLTEKGPEALEHSEIRWFAPGEIPWETLCPADRTLLENIYPHQD